MGNQKGRGKRLKEHIKNELMTFLYAHDKKTKSMRKGVVLIGAGLLLAMAGMTLVYKNHEQAKIDQTSYTDIEVTYQSLEKTLKNTKKKKAVIVFERDTCKYCQRIKHQLPPAVVRASTLNRDTAYMTINVRKLTNAESSALVTLAPSIAEDYHILTPSVARFEYRNNKWGVTRSHVGDEMSKLKAVLGLKEGD